MYNIQISGRLGEWNKKTNLIQKGEEKKGKRRTIGKERTNREFKVK